MTSISAAALRFPPMPDTPSHGYPNGYRDEPVPGPSQPSPSQRYLSQILSAQAPSSQHASPFRLPPAPQFATTSASISSAASVQQIPPQAQLNNATPSKSSFRLSHPPPAPSFSYLQQSTPQSKRVRLDIESSRSTSSGTSPLSQSNSNESSAPSGPLSSPCMSNARPLSGITRPLPLPPTPSPSQRPSHLRSPNGPLLPMPQRSIEDFEKLLPQLKPVPALRPRMDTPQRTLLQAIPPQPLLPPVYRDGSAAPNLPPPEPEVETLPARQEWMLSGFRSLDLDLERIAELSRLEQARMQDIDSNAAEGSSRSTSRNDLQTGAADRGLPSGSILEVLGPPGSGKSSCVVQFAITERLRALKRAQRSLMNPDDATSSTSELLNALDAALRPQDNFFSDDFWDAEVATADQVLMIDCEGVLTPEKVADAAWSNIISIWFSTQSQQQSSGSAQGTTASTASAPTSSKEAREETPEVVRRLVAAVLAGIHVTRVTSLAGLIALLHSLRPTDEFQDGQSKRALPTSMPPRTSLILIDSLSYHIRLSGGSSQDRKAAFQVSDRIRDMLLRLRKPFEYRPQSDLSAEEQEAAKQRCREAAAKLCIPTIVFTNQLGVRRGSSESNNSGRSSPSGLRSGRPSNNESNSRGEGSSMLAPLLNGQRPPQAARVRDERPPPSVALCGPQMWEEEDQGATAAPRQVHQLRGGRSNQRMGHDRGWPPSFLGQDVWRLLLFRHGTFGRRYAQMVSIPPGVQSDLGGLWGQTRDRMRAHAAGDSHRVEQADPGPNGETEQEAEQERVEGPADPSKETQSSLAKQRDEQMLDLLTKLRSSLFRWRPFDVSAQGLIS